MREATKGLEALRREKDQAIAGQQYEFAAELREREVRLQSKLEELEAEVETERESDHPGVTEADIRDVISQWTGMPPPPPVGPISKRQ